MADFEGVSPLESTIIQGLRDKTKELHNVASALGELQTT